MNWQFKKKYHTLKIVKEKCAYIYASIINLENGRIKDETRGWTCI